MESKSKNEHPLKTNATHRTIIDYLDMVALDNYRKVNNNAKKMVDQLLETKEKKEQLMAETNKHISLATENIITNGLLGDDRPTLAIPIVSPSLAPNEVRVDTQLAEVKINKGNVACIVFIGGALLTLGVISSKKAAQEASSLNEKIVYGIGSVVLGGAGFSLLICVKRHVSSVLAARKEINDNLRLYYSFVDTNSNFQQPLLPIKDRKDDKKVEGNHRIESGQKDEEPESTNRPDSP